MSYNYNLKNKKAISPLIATILLIVVAVAIIAIILSWGRGLTQDSIDLVSIDLYTESDLSFYVKPTKSINGRTIIEFIPPQNFNKASFTVIGYGLLGYTEYIVPLEPAVVVESFKMKEIDHGIILPDFDLILYLDNGTMIIKNIKQEIKQPSSCPEGYIPVPGNFLYDTMNNIGGFCISKYEMKMDYTGDGIGNYLDFNECLTIIDSWGYSRCPDGNIVSTAEGVPVGWISQFVSSMVCEDLGGRMINNDDWMTIARNIELVPDNWSEGKIGEGFIPRGHSNNNYLSKTAVLEASVDDTNGYFMIDSINFPQNKRTHILTNGEVIWDFSGNIFTWTDDIIFRKDQVTGFNDSTDVINTSGWNWFDYYKEGGHNRHIKYNYLEGTTFKFKDLFLLTSPFYNANNNWIGKIHTYSDPDDDDETIFGFLRGGSKNYGIHAGILTLRLRNPPDTGIYVGTGFRCILEPKFKTSIKKTSYDLNISITGTGEGLINIQNENIECLDSCLYDFSKDEQITLIAQEIGNSSFTGWSGNACFGDSNECVLNISKDYYVIANFSDNESDLELPWINYNGNKLFIYPEDNYDGNTIQWGCSGTSVSDSNSLYDGKTNTENIVAFHQEWQAPWNTGPNNETCHNDNNGEVAAEICSNLEAYGYNDWYLPAINQLKAIWDSCLEDKKSSNCMNNFINKADFLNDWQDFSNKWYWSSTEYGRAGYWGEQTSFYTTHSSVFLMYKGFISHYVKYAGTVSDNRYAGFPVYLRCVRDDLS